MEWFIEKSLFNSLEKAIYGRYQKRTIFIKEYDAISLNNFVKTYVVM